MLTSCDVVKRPPAHSGSGIVVGLDIYVGSLTRYYLGNWETIIQQAGRAQGKPVYVHRPDPPGAISDPAAIQRIVLAWRDKLNRELKGKVATPLDWNEDPAAAYFTDKPTWECYEDLVLFAAYDEHPDLKRPTEYVKDMSHDRAFTMSTAIGFHSRYSQLVTGVQLWLPCDFGFTFATKDPAGKPAGVGSSIALTRQLEELIGRTWHADAATLGQWRLQGADPSGPQEGGARFACALLLALAEESVRSHLPMKLDY